MICRTLFMALFAALATATAIAADAPRPPLAVVELFTSQGCSSCPPADDNVAALSNRSDVLALSFGVTYWNQLGWKDTFGQDVFTRRQVAYAHALGHDGPFTPQVVVDGQADVVGNVRGDIERLIHDRRLQGPELSLTRDSLAIGPGPSPRAPADVWLVRYDPRVQQVPIKAGENGGRTLPIKNAVMSLTRLGDWRGSAARFALPPAPHGLSTAVLVQTRGAGPILAAAKD
jgi:hypothetical protein